MEWGEDLGTDIVSSSLGYLDWYTYEDMDGNTALCTIAADLAAAKGVVVVNAAGNERNLDWYYIIAPADGDSVIAVGAVNLQGELASFSSAGPTLLRLARWRIWRSKRHLFVYAIGGRGLCASFGNQSGLDPHSGQGSFVDHRQSSRRSGQPLWLWDRQCCQGQRFEFPGTIPRGVQFRNSSRRHAYSGGYSYHHLH